MGHYYYKEAMQLSQLRVNTLGYGVYVVIKDNCQVLYSVQPCSESTVLGSDRRFIIIRQMAALTITVSAKTLKDTEMSTANPTPKP